MTKIHQIKDGKLHIYVRTDKYKGKLKSDKFVGRTYIQSKQTMCTLTQLLHKVIHSSSVLC